MSDAWARLAVVAVLILVNAAFSGSEIALLSLNEGQLRRLERARGARGRLVARLARDPNEYLATVQIGITLTGFLASATAAVGLAGQLESTLEPAFGGAAGAVAVVLVTLALTFVTLVVGELAPKRLAMQWAERWSLVAVRPLVLVGRATRPAVWVLGVATNLVVRAAGGSTDQPRTEMSPEEFRHLAAGQASMTDLQRRIIVGAVEAGERPLRDVLVPRRAVFFLDRNLTTRDALDRLAAAAHHRAPVADGDLDHLAGIVEVIDLLAADPASPLHEHVREAPIFPETVRVLEALRRMQAAHQQMAVVADEFGGIDGMVTVEDLVEELVGEIFDEYDRDVVSAQRRDDGSIELLGRYPVHDLPDLGVELPSPHGAYSTVAGLVMTELGRIAAVGDFVDVDGWRVTVLDARGAVVRRVRFAPRTEERGGAGGGGRGAG